MIQDYFISKINIKNIRHLHDIDINLSNTQKKHLILTGKNGSGKTSLLQSLDNLFLHTNYIKTDSILNINKSSNFYNYICSTTEVDVYIEADCQQYNGDLVIRESDFNDEAILFYFLHADRKLLLENPKFIETVDIYNKDFSGELFLKYLLYLNYQRINAITNNEEATALKLKNWFDMFVGVLREIYDNPELQLSHNSIDLSYKIVLPDREPFSLNEMADGYSSFLYIVIELMMKMEKDVSALYNLPAIVLIDEIETHLHVEMQKKILPFLTKMFPNVQFIITTHSPFVISSISNAVVYDLEKRITVEDMSAYSYEAVIEHYYDINMYSIEAEKQFGIYKSIVYKENPTPDELEMLVDTITYLKQIPAGAAEELVYSFREIEAQRRQKANDSAFTAFKRDMISRHPEYIKNFNW